ncbi:type I polyketide synthase [Gloeobacter morelensis]|uniref:Polyketide synthase n=1 Tax=Gloeobacter morelensis MG652769 TaxID=2781736 RepID=A0ABY3PM19_9CYAN|nr:polyketide synthase [Gloeobacter morelensis]UFP94721.1 polyketide synthase [Gloeobacter morelensis MG652769]
MDTGARMGEPLAIVGMGCRFPGGAENPERFWQLLRDGVDAIRDVPPERWSLADLYDPDPGATGKTCTRRGGFLEQVDRFDAEFFGISPPEAQRMDPQQRLVLEVAWEALEDAAIVPAALAGSRTGVFIGICHSDYDTLAFRQYSGIHMLDTTGTSDCIAANRLSYLLDLRGPSLAIDTACSSSLAALHLACQSLWLAESTLALAGGVHLNLSPERSIGLSQGRMLATDGRCKTFDAQADGYVRGEGCGVLVLKRLSDALAHQDPIRAIIRGTAVNHNGRSNGLTAPNTAAQEEVIRRALAQAGVQPSQVSYVETHATGTALGDLIEFKALKAVLGERQPGDPRCLLGSLKTNIGHLEAAAGIAGVIKVALALQHRQIPPSLSPQRLHPYIRLDGTPFEIPTRGQSWEPGGALRLAGVSAFGFGGTNAHLLVQEAPAETPRPKQPSLPHLLTLTARSEPALRQLAGRFAHHLNAADAAQLPDICFSANTGRTLFAFRLALVAEQPAEMARLLAAFAGGERPPGLHFGHVPRQRTAGEGAKKGLYARPEASAGERQQRLAALGGLFVEGSALVEWERLAGEGRMRRVSLPTYPFERQRYWMEPPPAATAAVKASNQTQEVQRHGSAAS